MTQDLLYSVVKAIVATAGPEKILLLPSPCPDADAHPEFNVLVVVREPFGPDRKRRGELARIRQAVAGLPVHVEALLYSLDELDKWREPIRQLLAGSPEGGKLLYMKPPAFREDDACETAVAPA